MSAVKLVITAVALFLTVAVLLLERHFKNPTEPPAVRIHAGDLVQEHYLTYGKRLQAYYESLLSALKANAPDLLPLLQAPKPPQHGYQILPRIVPHSQSEEPPRTRSASYSWPWTNKLIDTELNQIYWSDAELKRAAALGANARTALYERLARNYSEIRARHQNIDAHIQYNRLWQSVIAENRSAYDRETVLHEAVLERQAIRAALSAPTAAAFNKAVAQLKGIDSSASAAETKRDLMEREKLLARSISEATDFVSMPEFTRIEQHTSDVTIIRVPFYTDIDDSGFVETVKAAIEKAWRLRDGFEEFRVELAISAVPTAQLYGTRRYPRKGEHVAAYEHLALFPADGAILTTGAVTTHVYKRAIIFGPHDITPSILAHEFGHILGFKDTYFRAYKDLGKDGFQVMEVVADPADIMGAPDSGGPVLRRHFERVLERSTREKVAEKADT
jgi:hypothetical protein